MTPQNERSCPDSKKAERRLHRYAVRRTGPPVPMLPIGDDHGIADGIVGKELLQTICRIAGEYAARGRGETGKVRAVQRLIAATQSKTKPLDCGGGGVDERPEKESSNEGFIIVEIKVAR